MNNIEENLFDAIYTMFGIYVSKSDFSRAVEGTIIKVPSLAGQPYVASVNGTSMNVYSLNQDISYKVDDEVYILMLNGDLSSAKAILGKKPPSNTLELEVENVAKNYIQVSDDFILDDSEYGVVANNPYEEEKLIFVKTIDSDYLNTFTRLNIMGDFRTAFGNDNVKYGNYGLKIDLLTEEYELDYQSLYFKNSQMIGDSYNFDNTYFPQQIIFNISEISDIKKIRVSLYQEADTFQYASGEMYPYQDDWGSLFTPNISVKNLHLSFGYDISEVGDAVDSIKLSCFQSSDYSAENLEKKKINLSWIHKYSDSDVREVTKASTDLGFKIRWYKYTLFENLEEQANDGYLNKNWEYQGDETANEFQFTFTPRANAATERIKALILYYASEEDEDWTIVESDEFVFDNTNDVIPASSENTGAKITLTDNGYNGQYYLYGVDNYLNNNISLSKGVGESAKAVFSLYQNNNINILTEDDKANIKWEWPSENTMLKDVSAKGDTLYYSIKDYYSAAACNNTIKAKIKKDDELFTAELPLSFGSASLNGSDSNITVDLLDKNNNIIYAVEDGATELNFRLHIYDENNVEIDDVSSYIIKYAFSDQSDWDKVTASKSLDFNLTSKDLADANITFNIEANTPIYLWIYVEKDATKRIILQYGIPIKKKDSSYSYIEGTTNLLYSSMGILTTSIQPFELYNSKNEKVSNIKWYLKNNEELEKGNLLKPNSYYDSEESDYLAYALIQGGDGKRIWSQPITRTKNLFSSPSLNKWVGSSIYLGENENDQSIKAPMIAAGHKDKSGTFTGVVMGDYDANKSLTGLYGFQNGDMVFSFTEDGKATIGSAAGGQIKIDGTESVIQSQGFDAADSNGLKIDLHGDSGKADTGPYIIAQTTDSSGKAKYQIKINADSNSLNKWGGTSSGAPVAISIGQAGSSAFSVDWTGKLTASNANIRGTINAEGGTIGDKIKLGKSASGDYIFEASNFKIKSNGDAVLQGLEVENTLEIGSSVGGWTITAGSDSSSSYLKGSGTSSSEYNDDEKEINYKGKYSSDNATSEDSKESSDNISDSGEGDGLSVNVVLDGKGLIQGNRIESKGYQMSDICLQSKLKSNYFEYKVNGATSTLSPTFHVITKNGLNNTGPLNGDKDLKWFANANASSIRAGLKGNFYVSPNGTVYIGYYDSRVTDSSYKDAKGSNIKTSRARLYCRGNLIVGKSNEKTGSKSATLTVYGDIKYTGTCTKI